MDSLFQPSDRISVAAVNATEQDAEALFEAAGVSPVPFDVPAVSNSSHWHRFSTRFLVLEGELNITDTANETMQTAGPGCWVTVPERVLHSEHSTGGYKILAGFSCDPAEMEQPIDRSPEELQREA